MVARLSAVALVLLAACAPAADETTEVATPAPQEVTFTASEFAFSGPDTIAPGMTKIDFVNDGQQVHHMILVRIDDGHTLQELHEFMAANPQGMPDFITFYGAANAVPTGGRTGSTVDLPAGEYVAVCFVPDPADGKAHLEKGMIRTLVVSGERHEAPPPVAVGQIRLSDYDFAIPTLTAGTHTFHVVNAGPQVHEAQLVRLNDGVTAEQYMAAMAPGATAPPPGTDIGGSGAISQGIENWWTVALEPGTYLLICFVPDTADGAPHFVKGMTKTFTVEAS